MKKKLAAALAVMMLMAAMLLPTSAAGKGVSVTIDGVPVVWTDAQPFVNEDNRTMVPLRAVAEAMGLEVTWRDEEGSRSIAFTRTWTAETSPIRDAEFGVDEEELSGEAVFVSARSYSIYIDDTFWTRDPDIYTGVSSGKTYDYGGRDIDWGFTDTAPIIKDGRTYAPIRFLAECFDYTVDWDSASKTVIIKSAG